MSKGNLLFFVLIFIIGFILFANALHNAYVWDDIWLFTGDSGLISRFDYLDYFLTGGTSNLRLDRFIYYRPLFFISLKFITEIFGNSPFPVHFFQILLHITNTTLIFLILKRFFIKKLAFFSSLIFLTHPFNTEAIIYPSAFNIPLSLFFGTISFLIISRKNISRMILTLLTLVLTLSLLSKETGIVFIPLVIIFAFLFNKKYVKTALLASTFALLINVLLRLFLAGKGEFVSFGSVYVPIAETTLPERLVMLPKIIFYYFINFFYPVSLSISQHWLIKNISWDTFISPLIMLGLFFTALYYLARRLIGQQSYKQYIFFGSIFILGFIPNLNMYPLSMTVADRWMYVPLFGICGLTAVVLSRLISNKKRERIIFISFAIILAYFSVFTYIRNFQWRTEYSLYTHDIQISKDSYDLYLNLGKVYFQMGDLENAEKYTRNSIRLAPNWDVGWHNLGIIMFEKGQIDEANTAFRKSIELYNNYESYERLIYIAISQRDLQSARKYTMQALGIFPKYPQLWYYLSKIEEYEGNFQKAQEYFEKSQMIMLENRKAF